MSGCIRPLDCPRRSNLCGGHGRTSQAEVRYCIPRSASIARRASGYARVSGSRLYFPAFDQAAMSVDSFYGCRQSAKTVAAIPEELQVAAVTENLQLLPDFRANVVVAWEDRREFTLEFVNVRKREVLPTNLLHEPHDFQEPTACLASTLFDEPKAVPLLNDFIPFPHEAASDNGNLPRRRNPIQQYV